MKGSGEKKAQRQGNQTHQANHILSQIYVPAADITSRGGSGVTAMQYVPLFVDAHNYILWERA